MNQGRGYLLTEQPNAKSENIDRMSVEDAFDVINEADHKVAEAVYQAKSKICRAVEMVVRAFESGGRLIYVGAGTSGRLGVMDAAECPPTFMTPPDMVQGIIAGGDAAMRRSIEGAEDQTEEAVRAIRKREVSSRDVVMGIATGGTTRFVHAALVEAGTRGAKTIFLTCVPEDQQDIAVDVTIRVLTGPEVIAGSTRMKAGSATKMVLNLITTMGMIQIGKVYGNWMVDLNREACAKLQDRAVRIVQAATGMHRSTAQELLNEAQDVKTAIVMHFMRVSAEQAKQMISEAGGRLRSILDGMP